MLLKMRPLPPSQTEDGSSVGQDHLGDSFQHPPVLYRFSSSGCQVAGLLGAL